MKEQLKFRIRQLLAICLIILLPYTAIQMYQADSFPGIGSAFGQTLDGQTIKSWDQLVDSSKTAIIVFYWDSHCSLCIQLLGELTAQTLEGELAYSDIAVVAISPTVSRDTPESIAILVEQYQIPFPVLVKGTFPKGIPSTPYTEAFIRGEQGWEQIPSLRWMGYWEQITIEIINEINLYQGE